MARDDFVQMIVMRRDAVVAVAIESSVRRGIERLVRSSPSRAAAASASAPERGCRHRDGNRRPVAARRRRDRTSGAARFSMAPRRAARRTTLRGRARRRTRHVDDRARFVVDERRAARRRKSRVDVRDRGRGASSPRRRARPRRSTRLCASRRRARFACSWVSRNARAILRLRRSLISSSSQKLACRSCTHSKYETVTPPALARMSGSTMMPRSNRMSSASGSVGPLAASATILRANARRVLARDHLLERRRHQHVAVVLEHLAVVVTLAAGEPDAPIPVSLLCAIKPLTSSPRSFATPPLRVGDRDDRSSRARHQLRPRTCRRCRSLESRRVAPSIGMPSASIASSTTYMQPRAVALSRPSDPPIAIGLPVTTPGIE